jgi:histidinol-phosphate phosphatase family protein
MRERVLADVAARPDDLWPPRAKVRALLCDRDATLIADVPYNGDPSKVELLPGVVEAIERTRCAGLAIGLVTNQSGVGRGLIDTDQVRAVNARLEELVGAFDAVEVCPHLPESGCGCHKPASGLVERAACALAVKPEECVMVGDTIMDVAAALYAGASAVLVAAPSTHPADVLAAPAVASTFGHAVDMVLEHT